MAITTRDGLIAAMAVGGGSTFYKASATTVAGFTYTLHRTAGMPGVGTTPNSTTGRTLSRTSPGALFIPAPSNTTYLTKFQASGVAAGTLRLSDRLVETSNLSLVTTGAQTVNSVALPTRATGALDVELWLEIYTVGGNTASANVTAVYTNQAGVGSHTATLIGGFPATGTPALRTYQMALQAGDTGVQSVQSVSSGTSTGTAGSLGIVLRRRIGMGVVPVANQGFVQGYAETGLEVVPDDACLELLWLATGTASGIIQGGIDLAQG